MFGKKHGIRCELSCLNSESSSWEISNFHALSGEQWLVLLHFVTTELYWWSPRGWRSYRDRCLIEWLYRCRKPYVTRKILQVSRAIRKRDLSDVLLEGWYDFRQKVSIHTGQEFICTTFYSVGDMLQIHLHYTTSRIQGSPEASLRYWAMTLRVNLPYKGVEIWPLVQRQLGGGRHQREEHWQALNWIIILVEGTSRWEGLGWLQCPVNRPRYVAFQF